MSRRIRKQVGSSRSFGKAFTLKPERSVTLAAWWLAIHSLAAASIVATSLSLPIKLACIAAMIAHALVRRPPRPTPLLRHEDGCWSIPEYGLTQLALREGTSVGPFWISLRFGAGTRSAAVLLLRDQLDDETWRALQAELRRTQPRGGI